MPSALAPLDALRTENAGLRARNAELAARLAEAEETLQAIRRGEVDALVVEGPSGPQVYTLESAEGASNRLRGEALAHISDAVVATDAERRITFLNTAAERQYGISAADVLGRPLDAAYHPIWLDPRHEAEAADALRDAGFWHGELRHGTHRGQLLDIEASFAVLRDTAGQPLGRLAVFRDVTERKAAEGALREAKRQVDQANELLEGKVAERTARLQETVSELETFSYSISHDMRAPLRAIQSFSGFLHDECHDILPGPAQDYLRRIIAAAERMDRLIQDVLVYSRLARIDLPLERIELDNFVRGILESYPQLATAKRGIEIIAPLAAVRANQAALTQCLANLLDNAIKFTAPGVPPLIRVWTETVGQRVRLFVKDNGVGIAVRAQERIFEIFQQLDPRRGGTGVGLAVVRKAAERMGGRVTVESTPGLGSTFCLELDVPASR